MTRGLLLWLLLTAAGAVEFKPVKGRSFPDAKPAPKAPIRLAPAVATPGLDTALKAPLTAAPALEAEGLGLPAPAVPAASPALEVSAPESRLSGMRLEGQTGARIAKTLTSEAFDAAVLFDNVSKPKAFVDAESPVGIELNAVKKYEPSEAVRVVRQRARDQSPVYYIAPNGIPVALRGDYSSFVEGGQLRLLEARAARLGSLYVAMPHGTSALKSYEPELEALAGEALAQGQKLKQAMDRLQLAVGKPVAGEDLRAAFSQAQRAAAEYISVRNTWKLKRDALYAKAKGNDKIFLKSVMDGADFKKSHADLTVGGLLTERFPNADVFLEALYPDRIAQLRRAIPNLSSLPLNDVERSLLMNRDVTSEFLEYRKTFKKDEIGAVRALSQLQFSFKPGDLPRVLDRLRDADGALKLLEPELRALADEALPALARVDATLDRLERSMHGAKTRGKVSAVLADAKKTIDSFQVDATSWHVRRDALLAKASDPAVKSFLAAALAALEWDRSHLTLDGLLAKRFRNADELLERLYPDDIAQLRRFIPRLAEMKVDGFERSIFIDREGVGEFIASLRRAAELKASHRISQVGSLGEVPYVAPLADEALPARFRSGSYLLPYRVKGAPNIVELDASGAALPELRPDGLASDGKDRLKARFLVFDRLIESNFRVLPMMNKSASGQMTKSAARAILAETGKMVANYESLAQSAGDAREGEAVAQKYKTIAAELEGLWAELSDAQLLPVPIAALVGTLESRAGLSSLRHLHTLVNYMHKKSLRLLIGHDQGGGSGLLTSGRSHLAFTDLQDKPLIERGRLRSSPLSALLPRLADIANTQNDRMIINGDEAWYHSVLGKHTAEIYVKFADPDDGGMLRIRYEDWETGRGKRPRMALLEAQLKALGISCEIEDDQFLTAVLDKDYELRSERQLAEFFPTVIRTLHEDSELNLYFTTLKESQVPEMVAKMAELYAAEGGWPAQEWNDSAAFAKHYESYTTKDRRTQRSALRSALDEELARLGLPALPEGEAFGQAVIQRHFTEVVHKALLTGQLALDRRGIPQPREQRPVEDLADAVLGNPAEAHKRASLARHLGGDADFEPIGAIGGLRAERAVLNLGRAAALVTVLRDPETGFVGYARFQSYESDKLSDLSAVELGELMARENLSVPEVEPISNAQAALLESRLRAPLKVSAALGDRVLGLAASAGAGGFVTAPLTFDRQGHAGKVLVVPYTTPDDIDAIGKSAAVVATGGGLLSHAAITTREQRIPSVIVPDAQWKTTPGGERLIEVRSFRHDREVRKHRGLSLMPRLNILRHTLKEGDIVRVNGATGELSLFPDHAEDAAQAVSFIDQARAGAAAREPLPEPSRPAEAALGLFRDVRHLKRRIAPAVLPLGAVGDEDRDLVGGKFAKLGEILAAVHAQGAHVPAALSVTTQGYLRFLRENGLTEKLLNMFSRLDEALSRAKNEEERLEAVTAGSGKIRTLIRSGRLARDRGVGAEIWVGMQDHGLADRQKRLAVRSSAVQEDQQDAAFAGAAESYLNVDPNVALDRIIENWASFWLPRGILYRHGRGITSAELRPATIVQEMASADVAGVIFTRNPMDGADEIVINAAYGLGEGIVSGLVQTDLYVARKSDGEEIRFPFVGDKRIAVMPTADGSATEVRGIEKDRRGRRALTLARTRRLSQIAKALEDKLGYPLDIEFAISGDRIAILQARPVTTRGAK